MLNFPDSPSPGQVFNSADASWRWDGQKWINNSVGSGGELPLGTLHDQLVFVGGAWTAQRPRYIMSSYAPGVPIANQNLLYHPFSKAVTIPANAGAYLGHNSTAAGGTAAAGGTILTIDKAVLATPLTFVICGSITWAAGSATGTFTTTGGAPVTFAQGDRLRIRFPTPADPTLGDVNVTLVGFET